MAVLSSEKQTQFKASLPAFDGNEKELIPK
jgi:hypothetical protein